MKKVFAKTALFSTALFLAACSQQPQQPQVFGDTSGNMTTIAQVKSMHDDSRVILEGYIVAQTDDDDFTFKDDTGTIRIDVKDRAWNGLNVTKNDKIRIHGKLDKEFTHSSIDVYQIELVK